MFKFLHTADFHIGAPNQPSDYQELAIPRLKQVAKGLGIDTILVAGDIFDRSNPPQISKDYFISQVVSDPEIKWILTPGNHDYTSKARNYHSLRTLSILEQNVKNVRVCETGWFEFDDFVLVNLPEEFGVVPERQVKESDKPVVAVWHGIVPGFNFISGESDNKTIAKFIRENKFNYLALGDIHKHLQLTERCWYPGSLFQKTYSCQNGAVLVEMDGVKVTTQDVDLGLPKRINVRIKIEESDNEQIIAGVITEEAKEGSLVKMHLECSLSVWSSINTKKIVEYLENKYREVKVVHAYKESDEDVKTAKVLEITTPEKEIGKIVDENDFLVDKNVLKKRCIELYYR